MAELSIWVVLLNYKRVDLTLACLASLRALNHPCRIVVVDNASGDGSLERLYAASGTDVTVLASSANVGFGAGNNIGIRYALTHGADAVWVLNNDTRVEPDTLDAQLPLLEEPGIGAVVPVIVHDDDPPTIWYRGGEVDEDRLEAIHWDIDRLASDVSGPALRSAITFATGCSLLVPRRTFEEIGLFEERFFLYWEDYEFSQRLLRAGRPIRLASDATVIHEAGSSSTLGTGPTPTYLYYNTRNRLWLLRERGVVLPRLIMRAASALRWELRDIRVSTHRARRVRSVLKGTFDGLLRRPVASLIGRTT